MRSSDLSLVPVGDDSEKPKQQIKNCEQFGDVGSNMFLRSESHVS